jgi:sulfate-transporting ATPase
MQALSEFPGSAIVISHDRWFLDRICTHILSFEGEGRVEFFLGGYSEYEKYRQSVLGLDSGPTRIKHKRLGM